MKKQDLICQFSIRLYDAMMNAGFNSQRSTSGVDIHKLVEITGHSPQICRKYLRGEALPEPNKLQAIANALNVSPGWLLFGESQFKNIEKVICINKKSLHLLFLKLKPLYNAALKPDEIADFLLDLTADLSQMDTNDTQLEKMISLAINSALHFR